MALAWLPILFLAVPMTRIHCLSVIALGLHCSLRANSLHTSSRRKLLSPVSIRTFIRSGFLGKYLTTNTALSYWEIFKISRSHLDNTIYLIFSVISIETCPETQHVVVPIPKQTLILKTWPSLSPLLWLRVLITLTRYLTFNYKITFHCTKSVLLIKFFRDSSISLR